MEYPFASGVAVSAHSFLQQLLIEVRNSVSLSHVNTTYLGNRVEES